MERKNNEKRTGRLSNLSEVFQLSKEGKTLFSNPSFRFWQLQNKWKNIAGPMIARESYISLYYRHQFRLDEPPLYDESGSSQTDQRRRLREKVHRYTLRCGPSENRTPPGILSCPCKQPAGKRRKDIFCSPFGRRTELYR